MDLTPAKWIVQTLNTTDHFLKKIYTSLLRYNTFVVIMGGLLLIYLLLDTSFHVVLRKDWFFYVLKGMEIANGNFDLYQSHAIGWPTFLAVFYYLLGIDNIFEAMVVARALSLLLICLNLVPIMLICKKTCEPKNQAGAIIFVTLMYCTSNLIQYIATVAYTEPLFLFLTLWCFYFLTRTDGLRTQDIVFAALFAGLSYWVRANGLFHLFLILAVIAFCSPCKPAYIIKNSLLAVAVFFGTSAAPLIKRHLQFGSAFDYGPNSKYFVDNYNQVWDDTVPVPTLFEYLQSHNFTAYYDKFIEDGLLNVLATLPDLFTHIPGLFILLAISLFCGMILKFRLFFPYVALFSLTIAGLSLVFDIFGTVRHLIFLIPFILICCGAFLSKLHLQKFTVTNVLYTLLLIYCLANIEKIRLPEYQPFRLPQVHDNWALWAADNIQGNVALVSGGDLLRMAQHYQKPAIKRIPQDFAKVQLTINRIRPGNYKTLEAALAYFYKSNIKYVIVDDVTLYKLKRRTYLKEIKKEKWRTTFIPVKSFPEPQKDSIFHGVTIYEIAEQYNPTLTGATN